MRHIPPCLQQLQAQAEWHGANEPFTRRDVWKGTQRLSANSSVHKLLLITIFQV